MEKHHIENIFNEMIEDVKYIKLSTLRNKEQFFSLNKSVFYT